MRLFKMIYLSIGIFLLSAVLFYLLSGLPRQDRVLIEKAISLGDRVEKEVWSGLRIGEYPLAIRRGESEYVVRGAEIKKRKPALPVTACTAWPVNGEFNVFLPCRSELESIGQIAEGLSADTSHFFLDRFSMNIDKLTDNRYIAILCHEAMHAFQFKYYENQLMELQSDDDEIGIEELVAEMELDPVIVSLYGRQFRILSDLTDPSCQGIDKNRLRELFDTREAIRQAFLEKVGAKKARMINDFIDFTELVEGTARYVELKTAVIMSDNDLQRQYLSSLQETAMGKEKYYRSGMALCLLLDKVRPEWKETVLYGGSTLAGLLESSMEGS